MFSLLSGIGSLLNRFRKVYSLFSTDAETYIAWVHYMYGLVVGAHGDARTTVHAIARIHEVARSCQ